jgi:DNA mismatch endonuclease (patch repair protein)
MDIAFIGPKLACFIDGCFWHHCVEHYVVPKSNTEFWTNKISANEERDRQTDAALTRAGWTVLRFWEHQSPEAIADEIAEVLMACVVRQQGPRC